MKDAGTSVRASSRKQFGINFPRTRSWRSFPEGEGLKDRSAHVHRGREQQFRRQGGARTSRPSWSELWAVRESTPSMRRGFLVSSAAPAEEELVWLSTKAGGLRNHIARVIKRDTDNDKVVLALLADGKKRVLVSSDVHAVPKRSADARALTIDVKASESAITTLLGKWGFRTGEVTVFLQPELVNHILNCLRVPRVDMRHVRAMSCSSIAEHGGRCSITNALDPSTENWWISGDHAQGAWAPSGSRSGCLLREKSTRRHRRDLTCAKTWRRLHPCLCQTFGAVWNS